MSFGVILDPDFWLADPGVQVMRNDEQAAFLRLMMLAWKQLLKSGAGLPDDDKQLAQLAGVHIRSWRNRYGAKIRAMLYVGEDGLLYSEWLMNEYPRYLKATDERGSQQEAGRRAASARWHRRDRKPPASQPAASGFQSAKQVVNGVPMLADAVSRLGAHAKAHANRNAATAEKRAGSDAVAMRSAMLNENYKEKYIHGGGSKATSVPEMVAAESPPPGICFEDAARAAAAGSGSAGEGITGYGTAARDEVDDYENAGSGGEAVDVGEQVKNAAAMLHTAARNSPAGERAPDQKIAAQVLQAAGSMGDLIRMLSTLDTRSLTHVGSYGYFLTVAKAWREKGGAT